MITIYKAPVDPGDVNAIVDYLNRNEGYQIAPRCSMRATGRRGAFFQHGDGEDGTE